MNLNEFLSLLRQPDMSFIDAIETKEFQLMLEKNFYFHITLDGDLRWRLLYGLWVVLLDFADDPVSSWQPNKATIPGLPGNLYLQDVLEALVIADFDICRIDWSDEPACDHQASYNLYDSALQSDECQKLVEHQIEAGLKRVLTCDFSQTPAKVIEHKPGLFRKAFAAVMTLFDDRMPTP